MSDPQKSECPGVQPGQIAKEGAETQDRSITQPADEGKALATLKASLALAGHAVHELSGGGFLVVATRWAGLCRECPDVRALAAFARQIGARA
jgi:hypothetical protein